MPCIRVTDGPERGHSLPDFRRRTTAGPLASTLARVWVGEFLEIFLTPLQKADSFYWRSCGDRVSLEVQAARFLVFIRPFEN